MEFKSPLVVFIALSAAFVISHEICMFVLGKRKRGIWGDKLGVFVYLLLSLFGFIIPSFWGLQLWLSEDIEKMNVSPESRLYGEHADTQILIAMMGAYIFYGTYGCIIVKELRKLEFFLHHVFVLILAYLTIVVPFAQYYCPFFLGVVEISNIPLTVMDFYEAFPALVVPRFNSICRVSFAISFYVIRIFWWTWVNIQLWADMWTFMFQRPSATVCLTAGMFMVGNVFLTFLQFKWGRTIFLAILDAVGLR